MKDTKKEDKALDTATVNQPIALEYQVGKLAPFLKSIPLGIKKCLVDKCFTVLEVNEGFEKMTGYTRAQFATKFNNSLIQMLYPDDRQETTDSLIRQIKEGTAPELRYRLICADGSIKWILEKCSLAVEGDETQVLLCAMMDITRFRNSWQKLHDRAERDALTGLYDKTTFQALVESQLASCHPDEICALMVMDIDDFKTLNDTKGHLFGDTVLAEISAGMKKGLRTTDLVGRVGGDEFAVFLRGLPTKAFARQKAQKILNMVRNLFAGEKQNISISCSIGIALSPFHGKQFQSLFSCADIAVYQAKSFGKSCCCVYSGQQEMPLRKTGGPLLGTAIDSNRQSSGTVSRLVEYVFHILYSNQDIEKSIDLILEVVGRQFDVSRAYIFENSKDGKICSNTFEWCAEGITPEKESLQGIFYDDLQDYEGGFDENGIFYCRDVRKLPKAQAEILKAQGICSLLQCRIMNEDRTGGFVGFDECTGMRLWTGEEIATLTLLSKILGTFLLKKRAQDNARLNDEKMRELLDRQDAFIYAVDQTEYSLLFVNKKTRSLDAFVEEGMRCYERFYQKSAPCKYCPITYAESNSRGMEFYNPQYDVWTLASAVPIEWEGRSAFLVSCHDITSYKKFQENLTACETESDKNENTT